MKTLFFFWLEFLIKFHSLLKAATAKFYADKRQTTCELCESIEERVTCIKLHDGACSYDKLFTRLSVFIARIFTKILSPPSKWSM